MSGGEFRGPFFPGAIGRRGESGRPFLPWPPRHRLPPGRLRGILVPGAPDAPLDDERN